MPKNGYFHISYLHDIGGIIKIRSIIGVRVFFFHLLAKSAAKVVVKGFQEAALVPAEDENPDEEEQDWN